MAHRKTSVHSSAELVNSHTLKESVAIAVIAPFAVALILLAIE
jgi:hypothetical protein